MRPQWVLTPSGWQKIGPSESTQPKTYSLTEGQAPYGVVRASKPKDTRRFDKPNDAQIRALIEEDNERDRKALGIEECVIGAKKGLESGQIRVSDEVMDDKNKRVLPHGHVTDERGVTHIIPLDKVPPKPEYVERVESISKPTEGNLPSRTSLQQLQHTALEQLKQGNHRGRTFG
jgi:hypothetical protein